MKSIPPEDRTPFNSPRPPQDTPYWLRNGVADAAAVEKLMEEHRRRLGMTPPLASKLDAFERLVDERAVTDRLIEDIAASRISAVNALAAIQEWRKQHDQT